MPLDGRGTGNPRLMPGRAESKNLPGGGGCSVILTPTSPVAQRPRAPGFGPGEPRFESEQDYGGLGGTVP